MCECVGPLVCAQPFKLAARRFVPVRPHVVIKLCLSGSAGLRGQKEAETDTERELATSFKACCASRCTHTHTHSPSQSLSFVSVGKPDVPELPDWNIICKQHNRFMSVHHVCPSSVVLLHSSREMVFFFMSWEYISGSVMKVRGLALARVYSARQTCVIPVIELKGALWKSIC